MVFKEGVYSRIDYLGKGKISGNDLVTVVIKEMLTDGTVINDMEAKDQALTQSWMLSPGVSRTAEASTEPRLCDARRPA